MALSDRTRRYLSSPPLAQRPRLELLPSPALDWLATRNLVFSLLMLAVAVCLYLLQASFATTSELEIARLVKERDAIVHRNIQLAAEIAELERPTRVRERALAIGLIETSKSVKLAVPSTAAPAASTPPDRPNAEALPPWQQFLSGLARWLSPAGRP